MPLVAQRSLGSAIIEQLRKNPAIVAAIPILQNPPQLKRVRRCGGCGGGQITPSITLDYEAIKRAIANSSPQQQALVKQALQTKLVRIIYVDVDRKTRTKVF